LAEKDSVTAAALVFGNFDSVVDSLLFIELKRRVFCDSERFGLLIFFVATVAGPWATTLWRA